MARKKNLKSKSDIASLCHREFQNSQTFAYEISTERTDSLVSYNSEPYGNEEPGLSSFISSDVRDTIEWMLPQLVEVFVGGDTPVVFTGNGAQDVEAADVETKYCQYVFERQNKGPIIAYSWFKDALLQKNGIIKAYWDKHEKIEREEYQNKTYQDWVLLNEDEEFEIDECTIVINDIEYSEEEITDIINALSSNQQAVQAIEAIAKFHIIGYRTHNAEQVKIENVPPENFIVRKDHNSILLNDARYCCEFFEKTRSDLIEMGYSEEVVNSLPAGQRIINSNEKQERFRKEGGVALAVDVVTGDMTRDIITVYDHYVRADYNGDGVAELRLVRTVGITAEHILENEEIDSIPYFALTPYINTHKFYGRSVADNVMDLQKAKSQLWRNGFDAVAYSSVPRKIIKGQVNVDDLMSYVPGGFIRVGDNGSVENDEVPFVAGDCFPLIDRLDSLRAERTGFSKDSMGLNPEALANSTTPVGMAILSQSQLLIKMIATVFAYAGFEDLMLHIRELIMKNEKQEKIFDVAGAFLETDPREWRKQRSTSIKVGIGFAGKMEELATMQALMTIQTAFVTAQGGITGPLTNPTAIFNTVDRLCARMGIKDTAKYFQDPKAYKPPPAPGPSLQEVGLKANIDKSNAEIKLKNNENSNKHAYDMTKLSQDHAEKMAELAQNERISVRQIESQEYIADQELIYKYGKEASDNSGKHLEHLDNILTVAAKSQALNEEAENETDEEDDDTPDDDADQQPAAGATG